MIPFERFLSKLLENHKIVEIGSTEFKLIQVMAEESPNLFITHNNYYSMLTLIGCCW